MGRFAFVGIGAIAALFVGGCGQSDQSYSSQVSQQQPAPKDPTPHFTNPGRVFGRDKIDVSQIKKDQAAQGQQAQGQNAKGGASD